MNPASSGPIPRRHVWQWVFLGLGICMTPFVILAVMAASILTLNRDASVLRRHVMAATDDGWTTKVQLDLGRITLGTVRTCLSFVHHHKDIEDAKQALAAVRHASVGVYERIPGRADWSRQQLLAETDAAMQKRGWTRLVGVADQKDTVLIYVPQDFDPAGPVEICLAVVSDKELVIVSTGVDATALAELVARHSADEMRHQLRLAKLNAGL